MPNLPFFDIDLTLILAHNPWFKSSFMTQMERRENSTFWRVERDLRDLVMFANYLKGKPPPQQRKSYVGIQNVQTNELTLLKYFNMYCYIILQGTKNMPVLVTLKSKCLWKTVVVLKCVDNILCVFICFDCICWNILT